MSDKRNENTDEKGTCAYEKDIHVSHKGQGVTRTRAGAAPCKNGLERKLYYIPCQILQI